MSIKASFSSDGLKEVFNPPTLKDMCLYKCLKNKDILTKEVDVNEPMEGSEKLDWEKFRLKEPIQRNLVEALLDAGDEYLFTLTPNYESVLAAIRMSQPEHLVKVHVSNTATLENRQLEFLLSGGNVNSLDINGCKKLSRESLNAINKYGSKLEYLRIGDSFSILPLPVEFRQNLAILRTPSLKSFRISGIHHQYGPMKETWWRLLLQDFISSLEDLQLSNCGYFETLEFLEPAKSKLSSLSLRACSFRDNAWASLFKLDKLRFLDLVNSLIGKTLVGENVVQRLLTVMPNLTRLAVNHWLVKNCFEIQNQGSAAKRLDFLGILENDEVEIRKAKLLANDVAYFGTVEGELRILECLSNGLSWGDPTLYRLLSSFYLPWKSVAVISLFIKAFKNRGITAVTHGLFLHTLKRLLTTDVVAKFGEVLLDQCIGVIFAFMCRPCLNAGMINDVIDIMMNLDGVLCCDHYITIVPMVMRKAGIAMAMARKDPLMCFGMENFKDLLKRLSQLLEKVVDRFGGETNVLWGISSVPVVIKNFKKLMLSEENCRIDLVETLSSMIASLRKLCLNSGPRRAAFHSGNGVEIVMELLTEIMDGSLGLDDHDSFALLEILKSILQDTKVNLRHRESAEMVASGLGKLLLSVHSQCEILKSSNSGETTHYLKMESIVDLLNYLESDPRFEYKASGTVKKIITKLK